jgi:hypothetical protein
MDINITHMTLGNSTQLYKKFLIGLPHFHIMNGCLGDFYSRFHDKKRRGGVKETNHRQNHFLCYFKLFHQIILN